jgi:signal transduction histidine kinase
MIASIAGPVPLTRSTAAAIEAAAVLAVAGSVCLAFTSDRVDEPWRPSILFAWMISIYVLCGLLAWWRRPGSRLGMLMVTAGFGMALVTLGRANDPVVFSVGQAVDLLPFILFLHVFLAFPTGRVTGRPGRAIVATGYAVAIGGQVTVMALGSFGADNAFTVVHRPATGDALHAGVLVVVSALALAGLVVIVRRRVAGGRTRRRTASLILDTFALGLLCIAVLLLWGLFPSSGFQVVQQLSLLVLGLAPVAFLIGLLDAHLGRAGVGDLFVRLRNDPTDLRAVLAGALRDPSLSLVYWLPQYATWADEDGHPVTLPDADGVRAVTVIERAGEPVAALVHDPSLADERDLLDAVAAGAAIALENGRLRSDLHARLDELRGSRVRLLEAGLRERQRLERDLHDGAQQRLIALSLGLSVLEQRLGSDPAAKTALLQAKQEIAMSLDELRDVARGLHPAVLTGHGLAVALESLAARAVVPVELSVRVPERLAEPVEVAAYYVICEGLANVGKHARATRCSVDVERVDGLLVVEVVDDGVGGADTEHGTGLRGLADRVEALGGRLRVWTPRGRGTRIRAEIPCEETACAS